MAMTMPTRVTELLGIRQPVLQAPMAGAATPELAAAVSGAGGLGALGSAVLGVEELRREVDAVRAVTDAPFNLNFFCHRQPRPTAELADRARARVAPLYAELGLGDPPAAGDDPTRFDAGRLAAVLELRPAVVSFHFGLPEAEAVSEIRGAGSRVIASATTVAEAVELEQRGVDAVIAQGAEAGGHRGSFLVEGDEGPVGTLALVPQVVDAVGVPVIAAGGIGDGRGLAAILSLGAGAAQIGTTFLRCPEAGIHPAHRAALSGTPADETTITRAFSGRPARAVRNRLSEALGPGDVLPFPLQRDLTAPLAEGSEPEQALAMWLGQAAALAVERPAAELVSELVADAERALAGLSPRA
jgi:nitronate monooxygenase